MSAKRHDAPSRSNAASRPRRPRKKLKPAPGTRTLLEALFLEKGPRSGRTLLQICTFHLAKNAATGDANALSCLIKLLEDFPVPAEQTANIIIHKEDYDEYMKERTSHG